MKNLATKNVTDFTITESGEAFISQRKVADLCGVSRSSVVHYLNDDYDISQGLTDKALSIVVQHYAIDSKAANDTARRTLASLAHAGAKAYIYHEAGYKINAEKIADVPQNSTSRLADIKTSIELLGMLDMLDMLR